MFSLLKYYLVILKKIHKISIKHRSYSKLAKIQAFEERICICNNSKLYQSCVEGTLRRN